MYLFEMATAQTAESADSAAGYAMSIEHMAGAVSFGYSLSLLPRLGAGRRRENMLAGSVAVTVGRPDGCLVVMLVHRACRILITPLSTNR